MRHRDIHLLTVGRYTYTSDQRFEALHAPQSEEWTLRIRYPQLVDSGIYECQISTTPPIGHPVYLSVVGMISLIQILSTINLVTSQTFILIFAFTILLRTQNVTKKNVFQ